MTVQEMEKYISELETKNKELEIKAKHFQMDWIDAKQSLQTATNEIAKATRLDYNDYQNITVDNFEYNQDNAIAAVATIKRIFKALKRNGIIYQ